MLMSGGIGWRESAVLFDMLISPAEWEARGARPENGLMQRLWGKSETMQLLRGYVRSLERIGLAASVDNNTLIRKHIVDLAVFAATARCPTGESSASAVMATRQTAALDYIASHFSDPELSASPPTSPRCRSMLRKDVASLCGWSPVPLSSPMAPPSSAHL